MLISLPKRQIPSSTLTLDFAASKQSLGRVLLVCWSHCQTALGFFRFFLPKCDDFLGWNLQKWDQFAQDVQTEWWPTGHLVVRWEFAPEIGKNKWKQILMTDNFFGWNLQTWDQFAQDVQLEWWPSGNFVVRWEFAPKIERKNDQAVIQGQYAVSLGLHDCEFECGKQGSVPKGSKVL